MKYSIISLLLAFTFTWNIKAQTFASPAPGYALRIKEYVDSLRIIDTHEHLFDPALLMKSFSFDFMLLFHQNGYDDLRSAGLPDSLFDPLFNEEHSPIIKWKLIEPYWSNSFNTSFHRIILNGIRKLYGIDGLNESSVDLLSQRIKEVYRTDWFTRILRDSCRIDYVIQDGFELPREYQFIRYAKRFDSWINVKSKYSIDSIAILQLEPIYTLEDFVRSLKLAFENEMRKGMTVVKTFVAYSRPLNFEKVETETARKVFRSLVNGDENHVISFKEAKPLQDYMFSRLMELADKYEKPVAVHTGLQAGPANIIGNSNPVLMTGIFKQYPDIKFVLYHGRYHFR